MAVHLKCNKAGAIPATKSEKCHQLFTNPGITRNQKEGVITTIGKTRG